MLACFHQSVARAQTFDCCVNFVLSIAEHLAMTYVFVFIQHFKSKPCMPYSGKILSANVLFWLTKLGQQHALICNIIRKMLYLAHLRSFFP